MASLNSQHSHGLSLHAASCRPAVLICYSGHYLKVVLATVFLENSSEQTEVLCFNVAYWKKALSVFWATQCSVYIELQHLHQASRLPLPQKLVSALSHMWRRSRYYWLILHQETELQAFPRTSLPYTLWAQGMNVWVQLSSGSFLGGISVLHVTAAV